MDPDDIAKSTPWNMDIFEKKKNAVEKTWNLTKEDQKAFCELQDKLERLVELGLEDKIPLERLEYFLYSEDKVLEDYLEKHERKS